MSIVRKVQRSHRAAQVLMVVPGGQNIGSKNPAGVFEFKG